MKIFFFVGKEFSVRTNFKVVSAAFKTAIKMNSKNNYNWQGIEDIEIIAFDASNLDDIASRVTSEDVIIAASAGGNAAEKVVQVLKSIGVKPKILGFEPFGLDSIEEVTTIVQAEDPKGMIAPNKEKHVIYQIQNAVKSKENNFYGHAFYAVRPEQIKNLKFDSQECTRIICEGKITDYIVIPNATLKVGKEIHYYTYLVAKIDPKSSSEESFILDTSKESRVFQGGFILNVAAQHAKGKALDSSSLGDGFAVKHNSSSCLKRKRESSIASKLPTEVEHSQQSSSSSSSSVTAGFFGSQHKDLFGALKELCPLVNWELNKENEIIGSVIGESQTNNEFDKIQREYPNILIKKNLRVIRTDTAQNVYTITIKPSHNNQSVDNPVQKLLKSNDIQKQNKVSASASKSTWEKVNYSEEEITKDREYSLRHYNLPKDNRYYLRKSNNKLYIVDSENLQQFYFRDCTKSNNESLAQRITQFPGGMKGGAYLKNNKVIKLATVLKSNQIILETLVLLHNAGITNVILGLNKNNLKNKYNLFNRRRSGEERYGKFYEVQPYVFGTPIHQSREFGALDDAEKKRLVDEFVEQIKKLNNLGILHSDLCTSEEDLVPGNIIYDTKNKRLVAIDCSEIFINYYLDAQKKKISAFYEHFFSREYPRKMIEHELLKKALYTNLHAFTYKDNETRYNRSMVSYDVSQPIAIIQKK